jgi:DNA repair protein RecN (Recombination protein N)
MLTELTIHNFAIIERQSISFHNGFNVISGETGAGKSIILNALEFILGGKGTPSLIRSGADHLEVQALFDLSVLPTEVRAELPEIVGEGEELVVSRLLPREGRGKVLINGRLGTVSLLEEIVRKLVNICSQHHQTKLLDPRFHLDLLDGFCDTPQLLEKMKDAYKAWADKKAELARIKDAFAQGAARRDDLEHTQAELAALPHLKAGRRKELETEIKRIGNFERLVELGQRLEGLLSGEEGISVRLKEISTAMNEMGRLDPTITGMQGEFESARRALLDSELTVARYVGSLEVDASTLETLREELSEIARLERKYRLDDAGLFELRAKVTKELEQLSGGQGYKELEGEVARLLAAAMKIGTELREVRRKGADGLTKGVNADLKELNMRDASLRVVLSDVEPSPLGIDRVEFLISTNKGETHRPLIQIASGGELSRVMLVLKKILREQSGVNVLIFDEVDTGVSGGVARSVGLMLKEISRRSQVVCITHLPQVASLSDRHFLVNKEVGERAVTVVKELSSEEKVDEIARMLAGYKITEASRASARELITGA